MKLWGFALLIILVCGKINVNSLHLCARFVSNSFHNSVSVPPPPCLSFEFPLSQPSTSPSFACPLPPPSVFVSSPPVTLALSYETHTVHTRSHWTLVLFPVWLWMCALDWLLTPWVSFARVRTQITHITIAHYVNAEELPHKSARTCTRTSLSIAVRTPRWQNALSSPLW